MVFLFRYYLPLEKGLALYLHEIESALPKDSLCQRLKSILKINVFDLFSLFAMSPITKKRAWPFI